MKNRIAPPPGFENVIPKRSRSRQSFYQQNLEKNLQNLDSYLALTKSKDTLSEIKTVIALIQNILKCLNHLECDPESVVIIVRHLASHMHVLNKLGLGEDKVCELLINNNLFDIIRELVRFFSPKQFTDLFYMLVEMHFKWKDFENFAISRNFLSAISSLHSVLNFDDTVTILWIMARLDISSERHNNEIIQQLLDRIALFFATNNFKELAKQAPTLLWSLATLNFSPDFLRKQGIWDKLLYHIIYENISDYNLIQIVKIFKSFDAFKSTVHTLDENLLCELLKKISIMDKRSIESIMLNFAHLGVDTIYLQKRNLFSVIGTLQNSILMHIGKFTSYETAKILWSLAVISGTNPALHAEVARKLWESISIDQLNLHNEDLDILNELSVAAEFFKLPITQEIGQTLQAQSRPDSSFFHQEVVTVLRPLLKKYGITNIEEEKREGAFSLDAVVTVNGVLLDIEFNGPKHYDEKDNLLPKYNLRNYLLEKKGYVIIPIPLEKWNAEKDKEAYLEKLLNTYLPKMAVTTQTRLALPLSPFTFWPLHKNRDDMAAACSLTLHRSCNII